MKNEIVNVNIGGTKFSCWKSILTRHESLFSKLYQHQEFNSFCDQEGNLFFDRSPKLFEFILNSLRQCQYKIEFPEDSTFPIQQLINEIQFYGLSKTLKVLLPPIPSNVEIFTQKFKTFSKKNLTTINELFLLFALIFIFIFLILKLLMMTGFLTSYRIFYAIYGVFFFFLCNNCFHFINEYPNGEYKHYILRFVFGLSLWFYSSFIFTKIFHHLNGEEYWSWLTLFGPLGILGVISYIVLFIWDIYQNRTKNLSFLGLCFFSISFSVFYSLFAIPSYLDGGYIQSYWAAITPLFVHLIFGFLVITIYKRKLIHKDRISSEIRNFCLVFSIFLFGNWLNWIPRWILLLPIDLMLWKVLFEDLKVSIGFKDLLTPIKHEVNDFLTVSAIMLVYNFIFFKFFMMAGFLTTYKVFYPIYGVFAIFICALIFNFYLFSIHEFLGLFSGLVAIWFYSSFIFTKIFVVLNEGVYWRWITIMSPLILLGFVGFVVSSFYIISDFINFGLRNFEFVTVVICSIPTSGLYSLFAIFSYLDDGYIQSYWAAFAPLCIYLIIGFICSLIFKNTSNLKDKNLQEVFGFLGFFFALFLIGNWLNWISRWILFLPVDFMLWRVLYLLYHDLI
jgi:hypothetical protein